ncbi:outer membrane beta-barrel protein [Oceanospirillum sp. HFRX-1_2]
MKQRIIASTLAVAATLASLPTEAAPVYRQTRDSAPRVNVYQQAYAYAAVDRLNWSDGTNSGTATRLTFGQRFEEFVSGEAQIATGGGDHDYTLGVYGRGALPLGRLQIKGLLGVAASQYKDVNNYTSISYGLGAELTVWRDWYFNFDYMKYVAEESTDISGISLGVGTRF